MNCPRPPNTGTLNENRPDSLMVEKELPYVVTTCEILENPTSLRAQKVTMSCRVKHIIIIIIISFLMWVVGHVCTYLLITAFILR
jgi:hypothetical protein